MYKHKTTPTTPQNTHARAHTQFLSPHELMRVAAAVNDYFLGVQIHIIRTNIRRKQHQTNTHSSYVRMDSRVRQLLLAIKFWSANRFVWMCLFVFVCVLLAIKFLSGNRHTHTNTHTPKHMCIHIAWKYPSL